MPTHGLTNNERTETLAGLKKLLESRTHGICVLASRREIPASLAFRIVETAARGQTRQPDLLTIAEVAGVLRHLPYKDPRDRQRAKAVLTRIIQEECAADHLVPIEVHSLRRGVTRHIQEFGVMTFERWNALGTKPRRALTS